MLEALYDVPKNHRRELIEWPSRHEETAWKWKQFTVELRWKRAPWTLHWFLVSFLFRLVSLAPPTLTDIVQVSPKCSW